MLSIYFLDDDITYLDNLSNIIDWDIYGFFVCGKSSNLDKALNDIVNLNPNILKN